MPVSTNDPSIRSLLKLTPLETRKVLDELNRRGGGTGGSRQRRVRLPYENPDVIIESDDGTGRVAKHRVQARNLSTRGISVIHGQFMHAKRACTLEMLTLDGRASIRIPGRIERCRLVAGRIHEIGIVFDTLIDISMFVALDVANGLRVKTESQSVTPDGNGKKSTSAPMLSGRALIADDFEGNRKLYSLWLGKLGLSGTEAADPATAMSLIQSSRFDVILVDTSLGDDQGCTLIGQMRDSGITSPVIATSSEFDEQMKSDAIAGGADLYLEKPFDLEMLQQAIFDQLLADRFSSQRHEAIRSKHAGDDEMVSLINDFLTTLKAIGGELKHSSDAGDLPKVESLLTNVIEAGKGYGFSDLVDVAQATIKLLKTQQGHTLGVRRGVERTLNVISRCAA